jgi:uroporphyrinogen-III synthase
VARRRGNVSAQSVNTPLAGLRIVVTRAPHQAAELAKPLAALGASVILLPVIDIAPPLDPAPLHDAILHIDRYDWIIFTSTNGVRALGQRKCRARIATVGAATREFAERNGWLVHLTPEIYLAETLVEAFDRETLSGQRILIPSAAVTRDVVRDELTKRGALVDAVEAYRNIMPADASENAAAVFRPPLPDWITFASSSAVENLASIVPPETLAHCQIASIGPVTSKTIREHGLTVAVEAQPHNIAGLIEAIVHSTAPNTA